jgi:mannose-6-phosphate isomerase-like protein (cupin superfamily)
MTQDVKGAEIFKKLGIVPEAVEMPNGEKRLRFGPNYIYTLDSKKAWQNPHFHKGLSEFYAVEDGSMAFAEDVDGKMTIKVYRAGEYVLSRPGHAHNVYLPEGSAIHTVKFGTPVPNPDKNGADWWPASEEFDAATKAVTEEQLLALMSD